MLLMWCRRLANMLDTVTDVNIEMPRVVCDLYQHDFAVKVIGY